MGKIKATFQAEDTDDIPVTLHLTMTVGQWKSLRLKLTERSFPAWVLDSAITRLIQEFTNKLETTGEYEP